MKSKMFLGQKIYQEIDLKRLVTEKKAAVIRLDALENSEVEVDAEDLASAKVAVKFYSYEIARAAEAMFEEQEDYYSTRPTLNRNGETFGGRLAAERFSASITPSALAEICGVSEKEQMQLEADRAEPDFKYLAILASNGFDVQYILTAER